MISKDKNLNPHLKLYVNSKISWNDHQFWKSPGPDRRWICSEAKLLVLAKDKKLHQHYKGLSANVVREAFGWDENFKVEEYPAQEGLANG